MQSLRLALKSRGKEGEPLPSVFNGLKMLRAFHRRGQVSLIAAAPGGGKSAYATHYAISTGVSTLYFSPDSDRLTLGTRALAGLMNAPLDDVAKAIDRNDDLTMEILEQNTSHVWWNFLTGISAQEIREEAECFAHVHGEWPELVVLDNLKDMVGAEDNQTKYHESIDFLHTMARDTGAHVLVLHHVKGQYEDGLTPIPFSGLLNNVGKTPRLVLTFYKPQPGILSICVVKNTVGVADASGNLRVDVGWLPERSWFSD